VGEAVVASFFRILGVCLLASAVVAGLQPALGGEVKAAVDSNATTVKSESEAPAAAASGSAAPAATYSSGPAVVTPGGRGMRVMPPGMAMPGMMPGMPGGPPGKPGEPGKPEGEKKEGAKPDETPPPIQRPTTPPKPPDPNELKVRPDKQNKISFNFKGQPWPAVLDWLGDISGMSMDWQSLPGDYLNLTTPRPYTLRETRDLINRHLLARGFTLLCQGDTLSVVDCKKLNPALVPRIEADELSAHDPHEFVKVSFDLQSMTAEEAAEEFKPMLSPNGRLTPLRATNRLEAMDAVINLQEIYNLLVTEQSGRGTGSLPKEFELKYARASDVCDQLHALLGIDSKSRRSQAGQAPPGMNPEQMRQMAMAGQPMQPGMQPGQQPGQQPGKQAGAAKPTIEISLIPNGRKNSILAIAPPDKMVIIAQAIKTLDVPSGQGSSLLGTMSRMQIYRLAAIDPEPLVKTLEEVGNLDPGTKLQIDKKNRAIIVYGPLADHVTVRALVEKLDGSERKFEVVQLRRLEADYVAGTIEFMMTGEKPKQQRPRYSFFGGESDSRRGSEDEAGKFRVDADVENNRLLLWANPVELEEVRNLLVKLGEIPADGGDRGTVRVLDLPAGKESDELIERLRRQWPSVAPNPLIVPPREPEKTPEKAPERSPAPAPQQKPPAAAPTAQGNPSRSASFVQFVQFRSAGVAKPSPTAAPASESAKAPAAATAGEPAAPAAAGTRQPKVPAPPESPPPVTFSRGPDGRWIVTSQDPQALDRLEDLIARLSAASKNDYQVFQLKYAWASSVAPILKDVFKDDQESTKRRMPWWYEMEYGSQDTEKPRARLSKRKALKIIADSDTNSILVQGADATQLKKIEELIKVYDRPQPMDAKSVRKTETVHLEYSPAKKVADTIKDVYRDLLSSNDKALAGNQEQHRERVIRFSFDDEGSQKQPTYKGLLSIGVDEVSNSLILSAPAYLLDDIVKMVKSLDEAAKPVAESVTVLKVNPGMSATQIEEAIDKVFGDGTSSSASRQRKDSQTTDPQGTKGQRSRKRQGPSHDHGQEAASPAK